MVFNFIYYYYRIVVRNSHYLFYYFSCLTRYSIFMQFKLLQRNHMTLNCKYKVTRNTEYSDASKKTVHDIVEQNKCCDTFCRTYNVCQTDHVTKCCTDCCCQLQHPRGIRQKCQNIAQFSKRLTLHSNIMILITTLTYFIALGPS